MFDFIEHIPDPKSTIKEAHRILKKDGILLVLTVNEDSLMCWLSDLFYKIGIKFFANIVHPIHHTFHFTEKTLKKYIIGAGFEIIYKEKDEFPIEHIEGASILRFLAKILYSLVIIWARICLEVCVLMVDVISDSSL